MSTFLHEIKLIITGRRKSLTCSNSALVFRSRGTFISATFSPLMNCCDGYHVLPFSPNKPPEATNFFHCESVSFSFLTARQDSPDPSKRPFTVMEIFSRLRPVTSDIQRHVLKPSKLVSTKGYKLLSVLKTTMAPPSVWLSMLLLSVMGTVGQLPRGKI